MIHDKIVLISQTLYKWTFKCTLKDLKRQWIFSLHMYGTGIIFTCMTENTLEFLIMDIVMDLDVRERPIFYSEMWIWYTENKVYKYIVINFARNIEWKSQQLKKKVKKRNLWLWK